MSKEFCAMKIFLDGTRGSFLEWRLHVFEPGQISSFSTGLMTSECLICKYSGFLRYRDPLHLFLYPFVCYSPINWIDQLMGDNTTLWLSQKQQANMSLYWNLLQVACLINHLSQDQCWHLWAKSLQGIPPKRTLHNLLCPNLIKF